MANISQRDLRDLMDIVKKVIDKFVGYEPDETDFLFSGDSYHKLIERLEKIFSIKIKDSTKSGLRTVADVLAVTAASIISRIGDFKVISQKCIRAGQARPYQDSVYVYEIEFDKEPIDEQIWVYCQTLQRCDIRDDKATHDGHCGYLHGMSSFGSLNKIENLKYKYEVTLPYDD
jgi:hypothetical protein